MAAAGGPMPQPSGSAASSLGAALESLDVEAREAAADLRDARAKLGKAMEAAPAQRDQQLISLLQEQARQDALRLARIDALRLELVAKLPGPSKRQAEQPGAGAGSQGTPGEPSTKRIKVEILHSASQLAAPQLVRDKGWIPDNVKDHDNVAFYTGRGDSAPLNVVPALALVAPELAALQGACAGPAPCIPSAQDVKAALRLVKIMGKVFDKEEQRQEEFLKWLNEQAAVTPMLIPRSSSLTGANDGAIKHTVKQEEYLLALLEAKNEIGAAGDPCFQALRHYQQHYADGERWYADAVLRASGAPALVLELAGPNLAICGVFTLVGNVVAREPLTPYIPLLDLQQQNKQYVEMLARVVGALPGVLALLRQRYELMATGAPLSTNAWDCVEVLLPGLPQAAQQVLKTALQDATLVGRAQAAAAQQPPAAEDASNPKAVANAKAWVRLPYPLLSSEFTQVTPLPGFDKKLVCTAVHTSHGHVLVKFIQQGSYPVQVHEAWARASVTTVLHAARQLPGGWWMVVQELLDDSWCMHHSLDEQKQREAKPAVQAAVTIAHKCVVAEGRCAAHGDLRRNNVMVRKEPSTQQWEVRLVDLDWSGVVGQAVYPLLMADLNCWHPDAGPGKPLSQAHDQHLLESQF